jgi:hypothetical protein
MSGLVCWLLETNAGAGIQAFAAATNDRLDWTSLVRIAAELSAASVPNEISMLPLPLALAMTATLAETIFDPRGIFTPRNRSQQCVVPEALTLTDVPVKVVEAVVTAASSALAAI